MKIAIDDLLSPTIGDLEFSRNAHLFQWPGALIYGNEYGAIATAPQDVIYHQRDIEDWDYRRRERAPLSDWHRRKPPKEVSSLDEMDRLRAQLRSTPRRDTDKTDPSLARPALESAFAVQQQRLIEKPVENPFSDWLGGPVEFSGGDVEASSLGAAWMLSQVTTAILEVDLLKPARVAMLGVPAAVQVVEAHCLAKLPREHLEAKIEALHRLDYGRLQNAIGPKMDHLRQQFWQWRDAGLIPVLNPDGSINEVLTITNVITAAVALEQLRALGNACLSFYEGARGAIALLTQDFPQY